MKQKVREIFDIEYIERWIINGKLEETHRKTWTLGESLEQVKRDLRIPRGDTLLSIKPMISEQ